MSVTASIALLLIVCTTPAARTQHVRLPVTRDTWISNVGEEADGNNGGASRLKLKSIQEMTLIDIDPLPLRGHVITRATLHVKRAGDEPLRRVTVSTVSADWVEGTGTSYVKETGASTFNYRMHPDTPWAGPAGDLTSVTLGQGGSLWRMADASPPDQDGWQSIPVDPRIVMARVAGISRGFLVFDDTGTEWTRDGENWTQRLFPNRFVYSKDQNAASAPYFEIELGAVDNQPPPAASILRGGQEGNVAWTTPAHADVIGFHVTIDGHDAPRHLIPRPNQNGGDVAMSLQALGLPPGRSVRVGVRTVDGAGNEGPEATCSAILPRPRPLPDLGPLPAYAAEPAPLPKLADTEVAIIDELDKFNSRTGELIPDQPAGYLAANHLWSAKTRVIRLQAARGEFVAFQVLIRGSFTQLRLTPISFEGSADRVPIATLGLYQDVATKAGPLPDPIVPVEPPNAIKSDPDGVTSLHVEIYIPPSATATVYKTLLRLSTKTEVLELPILLLVHDIALPDSLSFIPEMNCYDLPANELDYYRLAHIHRTVINRVPYYHSGHVADGCAPRWDGKTLDFTAWDRRFGSLFDGSAFDGFPRADVPIECFYLPLFENWPTPIESHYNGNYWADCAFDPAYRAAFVEVTRQFADHALERGWNRTLFQFYMNGKNDFKSKGWSRSTSPWLLDEPANFQDFWALRYFGAAFHEGVRQARGGRDVILPFVFRADISRPQWQRESLDGLLDYAVVGGAFRQYRPLVLDRARREHQLVIEYGSTNPIEASNLQPVAWSLDAWSLGADGVLPWQAVGNSESWKQGDELSLFYPERSKGEGVIPSIRLKSYRRGQQDVEYMNLLAGLIGVSRQDRRALLAGIDGIEGTRRGTGIAAGEDAGRIDYDRLRPQELWAWRERVASFLEKNRGKLRPQIGNAPLLNPQRDPSTLGGFMVGE